MNGRIFAFLATFFGFLLLAHSAFAAQNPSFPSCNTPEGTVIAQYNDGQHGVPGDTSSHTGADTVYSLNGNQVLQCYCGGSQGIQSNWWKVGELSQSDISYWQSQGWTYIPDGSAWGLSATGYLAYNASYACSNNNPNSGGNGGGQGDGLGCATHDCSGNKVDGPSNATGGNSTNTTSSTTGFGTNVLGISSDSKDPKTDSLELTKSICAACLWWPVLLGEVLALVALYLVLKRKSLPLNKYILTTIVGLGSYLIFLILNKGHVCPDAGITFWNWSIPCRYFWALDGLVILLFSFLIRNVAPVVKQVKKISKRK